MVNFYFVLFLLTFNCPQTNSWKSIVPIKSMRADVEKIIGKPEPNSKSEYSAYYKTKNERVFVLYSTGNCDIKTSHGWNIPKGKVISISVIPDIPPKFADYRFDKSKFRTYLDDVTSITNYTNLPDGVGFGVNTLDGVIERFEYFPKSKDDYLMCKNF